jgi:ATP-dependent helicase HepA
MFKEGQRWFSEAEPELGLGIIQAVENKTVGVNFPAALEQRTYGNKTAPLKRVLY